MYVPGGKALRPIAITVLCEMLLAVAVLLPAYGLECCCAPCMGGCPDNLDGVECCWCVSAIPGQGGCRTENCDDGDCCAFGSEDMTFAEYLDLVADCEDDDEETPCDINPDAQLVIFIECVTAGEGDDCEGANEAHGNPPR